MEDLSKNSSKNNDGGYGNWDINSGKWQLPEEIWNIKEEIPPNAPDCWLSKPGGEYYLGMSFHTSPFTTPHGSGVTNDGIHFQPSPFLIARSHDQYNPWGVEAVKASCLIKSYSNYWDWLPGVTLYDTSEKYTLPSQKLSAFAGTEWADNDRRIFHGLADNNIIKKSIIKYLSAINDITGPRFAGWPFGRRQLKDAVLLWMHESTQEIHAMLLADIMQTGERFHYFNDRLFNPGEELGSWLLKPVNWDSKQVVKFLYKSRLLQSDGFHEIALVTASSAVEVAFYETVLFLEGGNIVTARNKVKNSTFMNRAKVLLPSYGYSLPSPLMNGLQNAYKARNSIAHSLNNFSYEAAAEHINIFEEVIEWYSTNI